MFFATALLGLEWLVASFHEKLHEKWFVCTLWTYCMHASCDGVHCYNRTITMTMTAVVAAQKVFLLSSPLNHNESTKSRVISIKTSAFNSLVSLVLKEVIVVIPGLSHIDTSFMNCTSLSLALSWIPIWYRFLISVWEGCCCCWGLALVLCCSCCGWLIFCRWWKWSWCCSCSRVVA